MKTAKKDLCYSKLYDLINDGTIADVSRDVHDFLSNKVPVYFIDSIDGLTDKLDSILKDDNFAILTFYDIADKIHSLLKNKGFLGGDGYRSSMGDRGGTSLARYIKDTRKDSVCLKTK